MKLKDIAKVQGGYAFKSDSFISGETPIIRIGNIVNNEVIIDNEITAPISTIGGRKEFLINKNDILIAMSGATVGKVGIYNYDYPSMLNQRVGNIKSDSKYQKYIYYLLQSPLFKKYVELSSFGCAQPNISGAQIENFEFKENAIEEISKIVSELDKVTSLINIRKKEIENCNNLLKSQFVEMFGDPLVNDGMFEMKLIKQIGKVVSGATPKTNNDEFWNGNNIWVTPAELNDNSFVISDSERKITDLGVKSCAVNLLPKNTVILSSRAPIGKTAIAGVDMYCNQGFKNIIPSNEINSIYLYELLKNKTEYLNSLGRGATFKEISKEIVENIKIKVPPIELQNKFAQIVEQIDKQKFVNMNLEQLLYKK